MPPPAPASVTTSTLRVADLSPGEREQLPALKISMHMWGPTPDQRFAIIDGTRVGAGDRVGEAVVEEIVADGVVLNWHGRRLSLPLR
jgi:general secretion pathway protein B